MKLKLLIQTALLFAVMLSAQSSISSSKKDKIEYSQQPFWSQLSKFEQAALDNITSAKNGDADALLMLYLVASGDSRKFSEFKKFKKSIDDFVEKIKPKIKQESSSWRKGFILHSAMHETFFLGSKTGDKVGKGYDKDLSQISQIFNHKRFNCISSSLLFVVLARKLNFEVQGVVLPSHAFVQLEFNNKKIEIETTTVSGYDWIHDKKFYSKINKSWFKERGLRPSSYKDYKSREILSPYELGIFNMQNQHTQESRMDFDSRLRLAEIRSHLSPDDLEAHRLRLHYYNLKFDQLKSKKKYKALDDNFSKISPYIDSLAKKNFRDRDLKHRLVWIYTQQAHAATESNQPEKGFSIAIKALSIVDKSIEEAEKIRGNLYVSVYKHVQNTTDPNSINPLIQKLKAVPVCLKESDCIDILGVLYSKLSLIHWENSDWALVIELCRNFLKLKPAEKSAELFRSNMQGAYLNLANTFAREGDWLSASEKLTACVKELTDADKCNTSLKELKQHHRL